MKENNREFILNPLFDSRYYKIIVADDDLKEWFRSNQDILVSMGCTSVESAEKILESENEEILNNKMIQELATIVKDSFKTFDYYVDKDTSSTGLSCVASNVKFEIDCIHKQFENYKPENRKIRNYDFNMIVDIFRTVYNEPKNNVTFDKTETMWNGILTDNLTFSVTSHTMQNGFEAPDWCSISLKLEDEILTINQSYGNKIPTSADNIEVFGATSKLIEKIYNEINISKTNHIRY